MTRLHRILRRARIIHLAPAFAFLALAAWAFASPIGAGPDDDYHLVSIWCANGGSDQCKPGSQPETREVVNELIDVACYAQDAEKSASCQESSWDAAGQTRETTRGNFVGEYPPIYHAVMRIFAGDDTQVSALVMRLFNAALFVGLATTLSALLSAGRGRTLLWGWLVTLVPLGMFLIPSNNPSGWAITGVGTAFLGLVGFHESTGRRRWALGALTLLGIVLAGGARGDGSVYAAGAVIAATLVAFPAGALRPGAPGRARRLVRELSLPVIGLVLAILLFRLAGQTGVVSTGFGAMPIASGELGDVDAEMDGLALAAYNLLMLPLLWTGVWGTWGLGWIDTKLPAIVPWAAVAVFVAVGFAALAGLTWRKAVALAGVLAVLIALPVHVLTTGGHEVGENLQPRYLLPLIVLFAFALLSDPQRGSVTFTRAQTLVIFLALAVANMVALQVNLRRYVTGADKQGFDLDAGAEWWWTGFPVGPLGVWVIGVLAYAASLAVLWTRLRPKVEID